MTALIEQGVRDAIDRHYIQLIDDEDWSFGRFRGFTLRPMPHSPGKLGIETFLVALQLLRRRPI